MIEFLETAMNETAYIAVDTETTNADLRDGRGHALGLSMAYRVGPDIKSEYFPFRHSTGDNRTDLSDFITIVLDYQGVLIFHNSKFDLVSLGTLGIEWTKSFYDTMLMAHMIDENYQSKGLDWLTRNLLDDPGKNRSESMQKFIDFMGWAAVTPELISEYAAYDAHLTLRLYEHFIIDFAAEGFAGDYWAMEQRFVRALIDMEGRGVRIDRPLCSVEAQHGRAVMKQITANLGLNPGSGKDLEKLLIEELGLPVVVRTPQGKPSFNKVAMEQYEIMLERKDDERATRILEYRGYQKTVSSNYDSYEKLVSPDGRLRCNYKIHGTKTGRLSCETPNLQQIPRQSDKPWNGSLKKAFIPANGYVLLDADYSQIEFRLAAAYANETRLIEIFNSGEDIFTAMAAELRMKRQDVKTLVYATLYGGGNKRISDLFGVPVEEAAAIRRHFFETYPGLKATADKASNTARSQGYVTNWAGRRRHFRDPQAEAHKAFNSVVQGGAAEIVKRQLIQCNDYFAGNKECQLLLTVHDSLVFEVLEAKQNEYAVLIKTLMEDVRPDFGVKFMVQVKQWGAVE